MMTNQEFTRTLLLLWPSLDRKRTLNYDHHIPQRKLKSNHQNLQNLETASSMDLDSDHFLFLRVLFAGNLPLKA